MNAAPEILGLPSPPPLPGSQRHPRSTIGRLPKMVRDQLNEMILDGLPYAEIKEKLGPDGENLTVGMISDWKSKGGYQAWYGEQLWREEMHAHVEAFSETIPGADPAQISLLGLQISLAQLCDQLRNLRPGSRKEQFENDAGQYLRMLNTLARLARSSLALQQYRDAQANAAVPGTKSSRAAKTAAANQPEPENPNSSWLDKVDDLFGFKSADRIRAENAAAAVGQASCLSPSSTPAASTLGQPSAITNAQCSMLNAQFLSPVQPDSPSPLPTDPSSSPATCNLQPSTCNSATAIGNRKSEIENPPPDSALRTPHSALAVPPDPDEFCLECGTKLPPPRPDAGRPHTHCDICNVELPLPGACRFPSTEQCPSCNANLPRLWADGSRPQERCHRCGNTLPPPDPKTHPPPADARPPAARAAPSKTQAPDANEAPPDESPPYDGAATIAW